ncbi:probable signal peptide protein [hydrothermal vent metagenome]|uniref:Probable signal peptide protein n=1 Tax=hydrothermal vent metagenome TaxID=652676 RepID=A0A3B0W8N7_9ZZZZ
MVASKALFFNTAVLTVVLSLFLPPPLQAKQENNDLMSFAILGALGSLGLACYQGKAPCTLNPNLNTNALTFSLDIGADRSTEQLRISLGADWNEKIYETPSWEVVGRLEGSVQKWWSTQNNPQNEFGYILGITPIFHYQPKQMTYTPFIEMGGGPYLLDNIVIENEYKSTQLQFGSIFGLGIKHKQWEISYRYLHISNAGIEMPNPGTDFHNLHLAYRF